MTGRCPKPARLKAFWNIDFRLAKKISSAAPSTTRTTLHSTPIIVDSVRFVNVFFINILSSVLGCATQGNPTGVIPHTHPQQPCWKDSANAPHRR